MFSHRYLYTVYAYDTLLILQDEKLLADLSMFSGLKPNKTENEITKF